ncbi:MULTISPECIES: helix-turn-helix domain-containing protein [Bacillota]|nr:MULTISPECIES: helix-turn-helix transcriptional regulator [Bacillota]HEM3178835.1 helix-turn-helix transcriptional regulator [Streptococcus suis 92-4172]
MAETAIGKYLKAAREAAGIKKWALAEKSGISHTEIHRIENGDRANPSIKNIKAICKALNIPVEEALKAGGYISAATDMDSYLEELFNESNPKTIAEKIRSLRKSKGLSISELANLSNLSPQIIESMESGDNLCDYNDFASITRVFGIPALRVLSETESAEDLVNSTKSSGDELLEGLSKSEELVKTLFRAKDAPKETMDKMAEFINIVLKQSGISDDNK